MQGILGYQQKQPVTVPQPRQNPWELLVPNLLNTIITGYLTGKMQASRQKELLEQQNKLEMEKLAKTEAGATDRAKIVAGYIEGQPPKMEFTTGPKGEPLITYGGRPVMASPSWEKEWQTQERLGTESARERLQDLQQKFLSQESDKERQQRMEIQKLQQGWTYKDGKLQEPQMWVDSSKIPGHHIIMYGNKMVGAPIQESKTYVAEIEGKPVELSGRDYANYMQDKMDKKTLSDKDVYGLVSHSIMDEASQARIIENYERAKELYKDRGKAYGRALDPNFDYDIEKKSLMEGNTAQVERRPPPRVVSKTGKSISGVKWIPEEKRWAYKYADGTVGYED